MVFINEWLPNPLGSDAAGEWVELWNNGNGSADISGWQIKTKGGSKTVLSGQINSGGYGVFYRTKTKLVLKNADEGLFLYDAGGKLVDQSTFLGSAPEGKSFSRLINGQSFTWSEPTPGAQNKISLDTNVVKNIYPTGEALNKPMGAEGIFILALGIGIALATVTIFIIKRNDDIQKLLFGGD